MIHVMDRVELVSRLSDPASAPLLIEVTERGSYERRHLPGAIHLGLPEIAGDFQRRYPDLDQPIVLYGASDPGPPKDARDATFDIWRAATLLQSLGYTQVMVYAEGKDAWILAELPTESDGFGPQTPGAGTIRVA